MPAKSPQVTAEVASRAGLFGWQIRDRRKQLGVSATVAAESAGVSRVTWHRIERGELSVTLGAYLAALHVLGMKLDTGTSVGDKARMLDNDRRILLLQSFPCRFPQLGNWRCTARHALSPREPLDSYERNWRHLDAAMLEPQERKLIDKLKAVFSLGGRYV